MCVLQFLSRKLNKVLADRQERFNHRNKMYVSSQDCQVKVFCNYSYREHVRRDYED